MFEVNNTADLGTLSTEYMNLWTAGFDGTLEVKFAPGTYAAQGWSLIPDSFSRNRYEPPKIDVVLRGNGAVLAALPGTIRARSLRLENLVLTGMRSSSVLLQITKELVIKGCALIDTRFGDPNWMGSYVSIQARSTSKWRKSALTVLIEDSWFVRNFQGSSAMTMLAFEQDRTMPGYFRRVDIRRSMFLGNAYLTAELNFEVAQKVVIADSVFYKTWPSGTLIRATSCGKVIVKNSAIVVEQLDHVGAVSAGDPIVFDGTRIYSKTPKGKAPPAVLAIDPSMVLDRTLFEPHEAALKDATASPTTAVPGAAIRARIDSAFAASK